MAPERPLPYRGDFSSPDDYVEKLLDFSMTSNMFQVLCGGIHILDFFTSASKTSSLFHTVFPEEWQPFLLSCDIRQIMDLLLRHDLDNLAFDGDQKPPQSFLDYVRTVRSISLGRTYAPRTQKLPKLPRSVTPGMTPKKVHEVTSFADYVDHLSKDMEAQDGTPISHFVDFGSGQNYLGRALASEPYNRHVVAVEGREINVTGAKGLDMRSGLALKPKLRRNKKLWNKIVEACGPDGPSDPVALEKAIREVAGDEAFDFKATNMYEPEYKVEEGKGSVQYVEGRLDSGDLSEVLAKVDHGNSRGEKLDPKLMAISIHSCGNLSHYGIRSLILNPDIRGVAIVGCCYNLMTERLGPPTYKHVSLRPPLRAFNGRVFRESARHDPEGFPMSNRFATYKTDGVRLNITARGMACQAPLNWTEAESKDFFVRHFYRSVLQKIFLDRGVVSLVHDRFDESAGTQATETITNPVVIGRLRKDCYVSLGAYVRGAVEKLSRATAGDEDSERCARAMRERMMGLTDAEIAAYEAEYAPRQHEVSVMWTMMSFSAVAVESLIVTDRWAFLREHGDVVDRAWVEAVFDYKQSPRNLVVVGVKKETA